MTRTLMAVAAVSGLMLSTALAQTTTPSDSPSSAPPAAASGSAGSAGSANVVVITTQSPNQWLASKFRGTNVIGADGNKIGDVSDILFDKDAKVDAIIVGVGGFLGIGQKDVALPLTAFVVVPPNSGDNKSSSDQLKLSMTKDQLKEMAEFKPLQPASTVGAGSPTRPAGAPMGGSPMSPANPNR